MNYHQIKKDDLLNGEGIRVTVFLSGCDHHCHGCHNPQTWNPNSGQPFDEAAKEELFAELEKDYVSGVTFSGGDPLNDANIYEIDSLCQEIKEKFPNKTIWIYTGYTLEEICKGFLDFYLDFWNSCLCFNKEFITVKDEFSLTVKDEFSQRFIRMYMSTIIDVLVDGKYEEDRADVNYPWAGSTNQRVIDIKRVFRTNWDLWDLNEIHSQVIEILTEPDKNIVLYESK